MKHIFQIAFLLLPFLSLTQYDGNTSPDYPTLIEIYKDLAADHSEIELYEMGQSDYGLPIYLCIINGAGDSLQSFEKARNSTTLLINNGIHPGEPDGINACLIWINNWIDSGKKTKTLPVIAIIPAYNVGGMMNRSSTSRANQNGPEEYGFRGNAKNLDLNRDCIKMDSKNMFTFAKIYHALDPDVFLDTHVSNGADYQYTMTYIASVRERMAPDLANLMHDEMIPYLEKASANKSFELVPYVHLKGETPETGIQVFDDLPRYIMGYASLMNAISFTLETHMLKPFPQRVQSTLVFIDETINWMESSSKKIESARAKARQWEEKLEFYTFNYELTEKKDSILFKGYEYSNPKSPLTGLERLKYHQDRPYEKYVPYYCEYAPKDSAFIADYYIIGGQCTEVIDRLKANNFELEFLESDTSFALGRYQVLGYENGQRPYEGHFLHNQIKSEISLGYGYFKKGDVLVSTHQKNRRFLTSVMEPNTPDSYFAWNLFDSYIQQKEYFSAYVFEDKAIEILNTNDQLKEDFEKKKASDKDFCDSAWDQLYFIYCNSEYYEPTHNFLPFCSGMGQMGK